MSDKDIPAGEKDELTYLFDLYYEVGQRICHHMGHNWRQITFDDGAINVGVVEVCTRCNETKYDPHLEGTGNMGHSVDTPVGVNQSIDNRHDE